jgi:IclR family acetate operon transcriptional repressor
LFGQRQGVSRADGGRPAQAPLEKYTGKTIVDLAKLEREIKRVQADGFALDDEEFLPGLLCIAALVPSNAAGGLSNLCVAVQAPIMRLSASKARQLLPALQRAALALSRIDADAPAVPAKRASA